MGDLSLADLSPEDRRALPHNDPLLDQYAASVNEKYNLPPGLLTALKNAGEASESTGDNSVSPKGATGVMQLVPGTSKMVGVEDPTDPLESIEGAGKYLAQHVRPALKNTDDPTLLAAAYNAGPNRPSLARGEVPNIPETKAYVKRVNSYLAGDGTATVSPANLAPAQGAGSAQPSTIDPADMTPEDKLTYMKTMGLDPTEGMSIADKALTGAGKFFSDTGRGAAQLGSDLVVNPLSRALTGKDLVSDMRGDEAEARSLDAPLMHTGAGLGGYMGAAALTTALPASGLAKAAPVARLTHLASKIPLAGAAAPLVVPNAITGGALSAVAPVSREGERLDNMKTGAEFGAAAGPLTALAGKGLAKVAAPVLNAMSQKINVPPLWKPSYTAAMSPTEQSAVGTAMDNGVPVYGSQLRNPGSSLPPARGGAQKDAFDRAIANTFGENTDDLASAFSNANERLSNTYNTLLDGKTIPLDKSHIADLQAISKFNASRSPRFPPNPDLEDMVQRAISAAKQGGTMSGRDYQNALQQYKALITQMSKSTDTRPADYQAAQGAGMLVDSMTKQAEKVMSPQELAAFRTANQQWRNMTTLESLAPRGADGTINVKQLGNVLARKRKGEFIYGKGDQTLPNLARFGNTYLGLDATAPKGIIAQGKQFARTTAPYLAGDVAGAYLMGNAMGGEHSNSESVAGDMMKYGALGLVTHGALTGARNMNNPALSRADLYGPRGALGELFTKVNPGAAAALTSEAAGE